MPGLLKDVVKDYVLIQNPGASYRSVYDRPSLA